MKIILWIWILTHNNLNRSRQMMLIRITPATITTSLKTLNSMRPNRLVWRLSLHASDVLTTSFDDRQSIQKMQWGRWSCWGCTCQEEKQMRPTNWWLKQSHKNCLLHLTTGTNAWLKCFQWVEILLIYSTDLNWLELTYFRNTRDVRKRKNCQQNSMSVTSLPCASMHHWVLHSPLQLPVQPVSFGGCILYFIVKIWFIHLYYLLNNTTYYNM